MMRSVRFGAPLLSFVMLFGACGGGGDDEGASVTTQGTSATTAPQVSGGIIGDALLAQRCVNYAGFVGAIGLSIAAAMDPTAARQLAAFKSKTSDPPEEIKGDVAVLTEYAEDLGEVLAKYNLATGQPDPQAIAAIGQFSQKVDSARLRKASDNISAWLAAHCPR